MFLIFGVFNETNYKRPNCNVLQSVKRMVCGLCAYAKSMGLSNTALDILTTIYENPNCTQKDIAEVAFYQNKR